MACVLTSGRTEPCKDAIGGLKTVYFLDFVEDSFTISSGEATAIDSGVTVTFKYDLNQTGNTFIEAPTSDSDTGTTTYLQTLVIFLKKQTKLSANEIHLLLKSRPVIVVRDRMSNYKVVGLSDGTVGTGETQSGGEKNSFNGYNLTFVATETEPAPYLDSATTTAFLQLVSGTNISP